MVAMLSRSSSDRTCRTCPCSRVRAERPWGRPSQVDEADDGLLMSSADARSSGLSWQEGTREFYTAIGKPWLARTVKSPETSSTKEALMCAPNLHACVRVPLATG